MFNNQLYGVAFCYENNALVRLWIFPLGRRPVMQVLLVVCDKPLELNTLIVTGGQ